MAFLLPVGALSQEKTSSIAAFPTEWINQTKGLYPIVEHPRIIQVQATQAIDILGESSKKILIEIFENTPTAKAAANRLRSYLIKHHKYPIDRFLIRHRNLTRWKGWTVLRSESSVLPQQPPTWSVSIAKKASTSTPKLSERDSIQESLASPLREESIPFAADEIVGDTDQIWSTETGDRFRPALGMEWFNLETDPKKQDRVRPSWIGVRAQGDAVLFQVTAFEMGLHGHYFSSLAGLSEDSATASVTEFSAGTYVNFKLPPTALGLIHLRGFGGYFGNWRESDTHSKFLGPQKGPMVGLSLSTGFDEALRFGFKTSLVSTNHLGTDLSEGSVLELGAFLSHRLFTSGRYPWDVRFGLSRSVVRAQSENNEVQEAWSSMQIGFAGAL